MKQTKRTRAALIRAVKTLGGISETARVVDRARQQVWEWCYGKSNKSPSPHCALKIQTATKAKGRMVKFEELRPDINPDWGR